MKTRNLCITSNDFDSSCKREECIHCLPPFKLYCFPSILTNAELRNKCIGSSKRQNKDKNWWKLSESDRVCSVGSTYEANSVPTLNLGRKRSKKNSNQATLI